MTRLCLGAAALATLVMAGTAAARDPVFPSQGCSPTSKFNACRTWAPTPIGDPTDGPLTDTLRDGPLDQPKDPLGLDPAPSKQRAPLLIPTKDRLGVGTKDPLGVGR